VDKIEKNVMGGACSAYRGRRGAYRVLVEKPEGKRPLGRPKCKWEDNIKMKPQVLECEGMHWIKVAQDSDSYRAILSVAINFWVL